MPRPLILMIVILAMAAASGCSRQQSDWQKARQADTADAYEQFLKHYPNGDFTAQAQARLKDLYTERDWQKARDADIPDAYQAFLKEHPEGKDADEARRRIEDFNSGQPPGTGLPSAGAAATPGSEASRATPPAAGGPGTPAESAPSVAPGGAAIETPRGTSEGVRASTGAAQAPATQRAARGTASADEGTRAKRAAQPSSGRYGVQLGAFRNGGEAAAHRHWVALKKRYPQLLTGLSSKVLATRTTKGMLYRLQVVGVSEHHARKLCDSLKAHSQSCIVVRPTHS